MYSLTDTEKITDDLGFVYEVEIKHHPQHGHSIAYHRFQPVADIQYGKMRLPTGDDDREWEYLQTHFYEWIGGMYDDLLRGCKEYFNRK